MNATLAKQELMTALMERVSQETDRNELGSLVGAFDLAWRQDSSARKHAVEESLGVPASGPDRLSWAELNGRIADNATALALIGEEGIILLTALDAYLRRVT